MQFHRAGLDIDRLGALVEQIGIGLARVLDPEGHAAGGGPMLAGKIPGGRLGFIVDDQVDPALPPQMHVLGTVPGDAGKAHDLEHRFQHALFRRAEFDKFKAVQAHGIFKQISHKISSRYTGADMQYSNK